MTVTLKRCWPPEKLSDLVGLPFRLGGRGPDGIDCEGIVRHGLRLLFGIDVPDSGAAFLNAYRAGTLDVPAMFPEADWDVLPANEPKLPGDVIVYGAAGAAQHVALMLTGGLVLQASEAMGSFISRAAHMRRNIATVRHR